MKRLLFVFLMMTCSVSWAEWELVADIENYVQFVDKATKRKKDNFVEMWRMNNYFDEQLNSQGKKYKSVKIFDSYDCNNKARGVVSFVQYFEQYGRGDVVLSHTAKSIEIQYHPIVPESIGEGLWKIACGRE